MRDYICFLLDDIYSEIFAQCLLIQYIDKAPVPEILKEYLSQKHIDSERYKMLQNKGAISCMDLYNLQL